MTGNNWSKGLEKKLADTLKWSVIISFFLLLVLVFDRVVARYFKLYYPFWTDDVICFLTVWLVFVGSAYISKDWAHLRVEFFPWVVTGKVEKWLEVGISALVLIFLGFFIKGSLGLTLKATQLLPRLPVMKMWWYLPVVFSAVVMLFYTSVRIIRLLIRNKIAARENHNE